MKNILHVTATLLNGGTEKVILSIAKENKRLNSFNMFLFVLSDIDSKQKQLFESYSVKIIHSDIPFSTSSRYLKYFNDFLDENKFDAIHCHINLSSSLFIYAAKKQNIPVRIAHAHSFVLKEKITLKSKLMISIQRLIINKFSTHLLAPTCSAGKYMFGNSFNIKGTVVANTIDINQLNNINLTKVKEIKNHYQLDNRIVLGCIGRFDANKNQMQLIHCFDYLYQKNNKLKLLLIGDDGGTLVNCKNIINKYNLNNQICILNSVTNIQDYYKSIDVLVIPSISEGFSLIGLEAQATNTKVLANQTIPNDIDLQLGLIKFVDINDFEKVNSQLNQLFESSYSTNEKIMNKLNQTQFLPKTMFNSILKIYKCD